MLVIGKPIAMDTDALKLIISLIGYLISVMDYWGGRLLLGKPPTIYLFQLATSSILVWRQAFVRLNVTASNTIP